MNRKIYNAVLFLAACVMAFPVGASEVLPFRAVIHTEPMSVGPCGFGCIQLEIAGAGQALHMGRMEMQGPSQVDLILSRQTGTSVLTAANGDTLVIVFSGTVQFTGPNPDDPVNFEGTWTVIDGTGRFAAATGTGTYTGSAAGPAGTLILVGSVSRQGPE